jgi:hypothetical protein
MAQAAEALDTSSESDGSIIGRESDTTPASPLSDDDEGSIICWESDACESPASPFRSLAIPPTIDDDEPSGGNTPTDLAPE